MMMSTPIPYQNVKHKKPDLYFLDSYSEPTSSLELPRGKRKFLQPIKFKVKKTKRQKTLY